LILFTKISKQTIRNKNKRKGIITSTKRGVELVRMGKGETIIMR
jgi:hypothetical protein